ncbi:MAG: hypothetical protein NTZ02_03480 [Candidatus Woesearchaeota archaeon]|nr:hypothetical protein [Candidatus Woesearchaeota archaeon]
MAYLVTNERGRKEFDSMLEAEDFLKQSPNSRVYEIDNFGNPLKLSEDDIAIRIRNEKKAKGLLKEQPLEKRPLPEIPIQAPISSEGPKKEEKPEEKKEMSSLMKYGLMAIAAAIVILVIIFMIVPLFQQLLKVYNSV